MAATALTPQELAQRPMDEQVAQAQRDAAAYRNEAANARVQGAALGGPIPGVAMPTDPLTRTKLGLDDPRTARRTETQLGLRPPAPPAPAPHLPEYDWSHTVPMPPTTMMPSPHFPAYPQTAANLGLAPRSTPMPQVSAIVANSIFDQMTPEQRSSLLPQPKIPLRPGTAHIRLVGPDGVVHEEWSDNSEGIARKALQDQAADAFAGGQGETWASRYLPQEQTKGMQGRYDGPAAATPQDPNAPGLPLARQVVGPKGTTSTYAPGPTTKPADPSVTAVNNARVENINQDTRNKVAATQPGGKDYKVPTTQPADPKPQPYASTKEGFNAKQNQAALVAIEKTVEAYGRALSRIPGMTRQMLKTEMDAFREERMKDFGISAPENRATSVSPDYTNNNATAASIKANGPSADPAHSGARPAEPATSRPAYTKTAVNAQGQRIGLNPVTNQWEPL